MVALPDKSLVDLYLDYTRDLPTPEVFRKWAIIHAIGAAAERRVWTQFGLNKLHPNLYIFLVGPPGVGKSQAINPMSSLLRKSGAVALAPNDISKQGLLDSLAECAKGAIVNGRPFDYHFMAICVSEMSNFMSKYDLDLAGILTDLFDCPPTNDEKKRTHDKGKMIQFPGISFIVGTATQNLGNTITDELWGSGFMARVVMVYSADEVAPDDVFAEIHQSEDMAEEIVNGLSRIGTFTGTMRWEPDARDLLNAFKRDHKAGAPIHNRLTFYVTRRWLHLTKLIMIAALADERMVVTTADYHLGMSWLLDAEASMPEIFKDMVTHSDGQIHEELRNTLWTLHMRTRKPIHIKVLYQLLSKQVASHNIPRIIEVAEAADYIRRVAGTEDMEALYFPQPPGSIDLGVL